MPRCEICHLFNLFALKAAWRVQKDADAGPAEFAVPQKTKGRENMVARWADGVEWEVT
jgi:hypothetical protein